MYPFGGPKMVQLGEINSINYFPVICFDCVTVCRDFLSAGMVLHIETLVRGLKTYEPRVVSLVCILRYFTGPIILTGQ